MPTITFQTKPYIISNRTIIALPKSASDQLPSRGQVMVTGTINGQAFRTPLEPDGRGGHWFEVGVSLQKTANIQAGKSAAVTIQATKDWPEPRIPADLETALAQNQRVQPLWEDITPMARWEWIRWINSTGQAATRQRRIEVSISKLKAGSRRPCCFNRNMCCVPEVSKNGVLLDPTLSSTTPEAGR